MQQSHIEKLFINKQQASYQQVQFYTEKEHAERRHMLRKNSWQLVLDRKHF